MQRPRHRFVFGLLGLAGCAASTVLVRVDDSGTETREVQKLDCGVWDTRGDELRAGIDFGVLLGPGQGGPYGGNATSTGANWNRSVTAMVTQYKELCTRYNSGGISLAAYNTRIAEIDQFWAEAQGIRQSADEITRGHARESFGDLDRAAPDRAASPPGDDRQRVVMAVDALVAKLGAR